MWRRAAAFLGCDHTSKSPSTSSYCPCARGHLAIRTLRRATELDLKQGPAAVPGPGVWAGALQPRPALDTPVHQEDAPRGYRGGRPTLVSTLSDRRVDVALGNQNKVKYMATQLLAKFEENAPAQATGVRRQVSPAHTSPARTWAGHRGRGVSE